MRRWLLSCLLLAPLAGARGAEVPRPVFYLPLDGSTTAALAGGPAAPRFAGEDDPILTLVGQGAARFSLGRVGRCLDVLEAPLVYRCAGNFRPDEGACSLWLSLHFRGDDRTRYCTFFGAADWGMLYKYTDQRSLTLGTAKPGGDLYYDCGGADTGAWQPDEWHHVVACWSRAENARRIYVDGVLGAQGPFPYHRPVKDGPLFIGSGCTLYPGHTAQARIDEVALWDRPLDDAAVRALYELGSAGKPLWATPGAAGAAADAGARMNVVRPQLPPVPGKPAAPQVRRERTRETVPLDGWWAFVPAAEPLAELPDKGWGLSRVPGYWTAPGSTLGPDGRPIEGTWQGRPLGELMVGYHQRAFTADARWRGRPVFLQVDGVDGLADVYLNGRRLGRLPGWEPEAYDAGAVLRYGQENTLTLALHRRGTSANTGVFGSVTLRVLPRSFVSDVVVRPRVARGRIEFSCDVWHAGEARAAALELDVAPAKPRPTRRTAPGKSVKRFTFPCRLAPSPRGQAELSAQVRRVECAFAWLGAHPWTYDDPYRYQVKARLRVAGAVVDEAPAVRFGYRELTMQGHRFFLNGKPTHLRGHQIDLGWGDQMPHVRELKAAGMNAFELSGPIRADWYGGTPYRTQAFEEILDYADTHGLVAVPALPDARALKERLFDPEVARLYRRRVDKHVRRYGNHPSIGLWFMHFNLAGYPWYVAPSKVDGSFKPLDEGFRRKERYALKAQRLARSVDPRPIYHHACGNFGDIFSNNCYIGPNTPLQEREEWPSRWAEKRAFPLVACEHCLMLIPYWFRARRFPLSDVYASEPIFDEIAAMYLGPAAYAQVTPELFDLYDTDRERRGNRTYALIRHHRGYQQVKSLFARHSLRAWRTYGVSGIIFNAVNWDFKDDAGKSLPVMRALGRYFGDTDLYIAGPPGNWPSKDHSFACGERIRKQVVLLNDLTRDLPVRLGWRLQDGTGRAYASGRLQAVARAGTPTFCPIECVAPKVPARQRLELVVSVLSQPGRHFLPERLALEVFPPAPRPAVGGQILVFDPAGETAAMLRRARVPWQPLSDASDLTRARLLVVGKRSYGEAFVALARKLGLEQAVAGGLNLLVLEQTVGSPFGLKLEEQSARQAFITAPGHPFLRGLAAEDFANLRGESELVPPYPDAPPETEHAWPARFFKWGNRGVLATYVAARPHYAPFAPVLVCGFDLNGSPLMEARAGRGRAVLCQVDVTSRCGADPVSTRLVANFLSELTRPPEPAVPPCAFAGESARELLAPFGVVPAAFEGQRTGLIFVGREPVDAGGVAALEAAARGGATVVLLPGAACAEAFGLRLGEGRLYRGHLAGALAGLTEGDLFLKRWVTLQAAQPADGWRDVVRPGIVAVRELPPGRIVTCQLDPAALGATRARVKALRLWNGLLTHLGAPRTGLGDFLQPAGRLYEENEWEQIPPYINW